MLSLLAGVAPDLAHHLATHFSAHFAAMLTADPGTSPPAPAGLVQVPARPLAHGVGPRFGQARGREAGLTLDGLLSEPPGEPGDARVGLASDAVIAFAPAQPPPPGGGNVPDPDATAPPGAEKLLTLLGYIKWIALAAISAAFFGGVATFTGGRIFDNRRAGSIGSIMILVSLAGALAFGIAPLLLNSFSSG